MVLYKRVGMELKKTKMSFCLIVVGLLDLRAHSQSDVMSAEMGGMFGDVRLSNFPQIKEEESQ